METPMMFFITSPNKKTALELAQQLTSQRIAACANLIDRITSIYWWEDKINTEEEVMMIVKTTENKSEELIKFIQDNHPYEVPECVGIQITKGSEPYLRWIHESTGGYPK